MNLGKISVLAETDKKMLKRLNLLIRDIARSPYGGIGKPEALNTITAVFGQGEKTKNTD